jgi:hypothetical protein
MFFKIDKINLPEHLQYKICLKTSTIAQKKAAIYKFIKKIL